VVERLHGLPPGLPPGPLPQRTTSPD
jgi:hypothetical protein